jgi:hypothetical protein
MMSSGARRGTDGPEDTPFAISGSIVVTARQVSRLTRVWTHSEAHKSILAKSRHAQQIKLFDTHKIWSDTIIVDICNLYPPIHKGQGLLGPYQVRPVLKYFLEQLKKRMETTRVFKQVVPYVLLVDPDQCATREEFMMDKKGKYKNYVIKGNHSACAWLDLAKANPYLDSVRRIHAWIIAGVSIQEARALALGHNVDNEFRSSMTTI